MAGLTPYGDPTAAINARLSALDEVIAGLRKEVAGIGEQEGGIARARARLEAEARGSAVGRAPTGIIGGPGNGAITEPEVLTQTRYNAAFQEYSARLGTAVQDQRSYGALTTEYFASLQRGSTTLRDLGFQVTSTIQKFGGWLGAGAAVYGALGAVTAIGKGAIDSASGVNQLNRVTNQATQNSDAAQASFRGLAEKFNLPISDVSDAAYQMGKVFHDQNDALKASESVLYAVKVGELDVASASRYLTSITNGFQLKAKETPGIFDQINQAQNRYNISTQSVLAGTAKAAGSFRLAGGDATHLIAIITALSKATGQTGDVIGTAIQRSPHFIALAKNTSTLESLGIDTKASVTDIYDQAIKVAQNESRDKQRILAEALFGPQYGARVGTAFLQQGDLYNKVLADVSPENAKGSAQRELNTTLDSTSEHLKRIVTDLEVLGSELNSAGFLTPFKLLIGGLDEALSVTNNLLEAFNALPAPLRTSVALLLEAAAAVKVLRFFNVGQGFAEGSAGAKLFTRGGFSGGVAQQRTIYNDVLATQGNDLATARASTTGALGGANLRLERARVLEQQAQRAGASLGAESDASRAAAAATVKRQQAEVRVAELDEEYAIVLQQQLLVARQQAALRGGANPEALAKQYGVILPGAIGRPSITEAQRIEEEIARRNGGLGTSASGLLLPAGIAGTTAGEVSQAESAGLTSRLAALHLAANNAINDPATALKGAGASATASLAKAKGAIVGLPATFSAVGTQLKGEAAALAAMVGPLELIIAGAILIPEIASQLSDSTNKAQATLDALKPAADAKEFQRQIDSLNQGFKTNAFEQITGLGAALESERAATATTLVSVRNIALQQLVQGKVANLTKGTIFPEDITKQADEYTKHLKDGFLNQDQFNRAIGNLVKTVKGSSGAFDPGVAEQLAAQIRLQVLDFKGTSAAYQDFASIAPDALQKTLQSYQSILSGGQGTGQDSAFLIKGALENYAKGFALKGNGPTALAKREAAAQSIDTLIQAIQGEAQQNFEVASGLAKGQAERDAAYSDYIKSLDPSQLTKGYKQERGDLNSQLSDTRKKIELFKREIETSHSKLDSSTGVPGLDSVLNVVGALKQSGVDLPGGAVSSSLDALLKLRRQDVPPELRKQLDDAQKSAKTIQAQLGDLKKSYKYAQDRLKIIRQQQQDARFQEDQAFFEAQTQVQSYGYAAGLPRIEFELGRIGDEVQRAIEHYGRDSKEVLGLIAQQKSLVDQRVQEQESLIEAQGALAGASINSTLDPVGAARASIATLKTQLAFEQAHPGTYKQADIVSLEAQIRQAQVELSQTVRDQAQQLAEDAFAVREARANAAGHQVAAAKIEVAKALYDLHHAQTPDQRSQDRAALIDARANKQQAIFDTEFGDIQFQADIGKLTLAQQIAAYQNLLDTLKLTKDMRRQLREQIYQLKQQDFDLSVGDITLPTIYDIRRAVAGGLTNHSQSVVQINNNVKVEAKGADAHEVTSKLTTALGGANRSALKAAGLI